MSSDPSRFNTVSGKHSRGRRMAQQGWLARHRVVLILTACGAMLFSACGGWVFYLNNQLSDVPRIALNLDDDARPDSGSGSGEALNILLAGADAGDGPSIAETVASGSWDPGSHRSDTIIVLHVTADRDEAYLISVPRDTWVDIDGVGEGKLNAAFSNGGPSLYVETLEDFTDLRMDHLAIIDWEGFRELTMAIGGVPVYIPEDIYDPSQKVQWDQGSSKLEGQRALQYVRMRYGLEHGDFDRIKRQQNFLRAFMKKMLANGTTSNPVKLTNSVEAIVKYLTVDDEFSNGEMRSLALSLRSLESKDVTFLTAPKKGFDTIDGQSVIIPDMRRTRALFEAVADDDIDSYLDRYGRDDMLGRATSVS